MLEFLRDNVRMYGLPDPGRLGSAVCLVAHQGSYRCWKHDPNPGQRLLWHRDDALTKPSAGHRTAVRIARSRDIKA